jgi:hypothetical protein
MLFSRRFLKFITLFLALNLSSSVYSSDLRRFGIYTVRDGEKNIPTLKKRAGNIESLNLSSNDFGDSYFKKLFSNKSFPKMKSLDLSGNSLTSLGFASTASIVLFPALEKLTIYGYKIQKSDLTDFFKKHTPNLKVLHINRKISEEMRKSFQEKGVKINPIIGAAKKEPGDGSLDSGAGAAY